MKINISFNQNIVTVKAGSKKLEVYENSPSWNSESINEFLIHCASIVNQNEKLELSAQDDQEQNTTYNYIYKLFETFINEYNNKDEK